MLSEMEQVALLSDLKDKMIPELDDRYVLRSICNDRQGNMATKFANDDKRIELLTSKFSTIEKLIWVIATASIGSLVAELFKLMLQ